MDTIQTKTVESFAKTLKDDEKSDKTIIKYVRDVRAFAAFLGNRELSKAEVMSYKKQIIRTYAPSSVNSMLVSVNTFLKFIEKDNFCVKLLKIQRQMFINEKKDLTLSEYQKLLLAAKGSRLAMVLQTICETGIRISELSYITVEAVKQGKAIVDCKNKTRVILIPAGLRGILLQYIKKAGIITGPVFVTRNGKPLDRSNVWREMKALCQKAGLESQKVFPHNLRHLFAKTFYSLERDIVRLADVLGHSSINTTRIYTMESSEMHYSSMNRLHDLMTT